MENGKSNNNIVNWFLIIFQLLTPMAVVYMGHYFANQIEEVNREHKKIELEIHKIDIAKNFLNELFSGIPERAFIAERLISNVVNDSMKIEIESILSDYYKNEINKFIESKNYEKTNEIIQAAKSMNSQAGQKIAKDLSNEQFYIVIASIKQKEDAINYAKKYINKGYKCNIYFTKAQYYAITIGKYSYQQANDIINRELEKKAIISSSWITKGKSFLEKIEF